MHRASRLATVGASALALFTAAPAFAESPPGHYRQRNLVTNFPDKYRMKLRRPDVTLENPLVVNAWGLALRPAGAGGHWWIANTDSGTVATYVGDTDRQALFQDELQSVATESASATPTAPATPTGQVFNGSAAFPCTGKTFTGATITAPSKFLVDTEDGNIQCWSETGSAQSQRMQSFRIVVTGEAGSIYKGLAITDYPGDNYLYAVNFGLGRIEVYDGAYRPVLPGSFQRPADIPPEYAPFNAEFFRYSAGGRRKESVIVAYAALTEEPGEEGPGLGYVAEFDVRGKHLRTLQYSSRLNAPWGLAIAPRDFGPHGRRLLVGNFGDGTIVAFNLGTGQQVDYLRDRTGQAVQIDGLWDLAFGNGESLGRANYLYFTAGPNGEADGLFGSLNWMD